MQTCKTSAFQSITNSLFGKACVRRCLGPTDLLLEEQWLDARKMNSYLSSERFRAVVGAVKVLGKLIDVRTSEMKIVENG
jgi:hypothetical protein